MAVIGSTDLGDGRLALTVDVDPTVSFPPEASSGDLINFEGIWYRAADGPSVVPEINIHNQLHRHGGIDEVATVTPGAHEIPKAGADGEVDRNWLPEFVGSGPLAAKGVVPAPPSDAGTDRYMREDGSWLIPPGDISRVGVITTEGGVVYTRNKYTGGPIDLVVH